MRQKIAESMESMTYLYLCTKALFHCRFGMMHGALEKRVSQHSWTEIFADDQAERVLFLGMRPTMPSNSAIDLKALEVGKLTGLEELNRGGTGQWTLSKVEPLALIKEMVHVHDNGEGGNSEAARFMMGIP